MSWSNLRRRYGDVWTVRLRRKITGDYNVLVTYTLPFGSTGSILVGGVELETGSVALARLDRAHAALVYVFQYLIGNTDWSFVTAEHEEFCCHNGDLMDIDGTIYYLPYDFDLAGIVNARYARPQPKMRLRSVRQRRYRGFCTDTETLRAAIRHLNARRDDIHEVIGATPGLSDKDSEKIADYLDAYFERAQDEDKLLRSFERDCI